MLNTHLQAVGVKLHAPIQMCICSLYIPPNDHIIETDLRNLLDQIPAPLLIGGDLNARNLLWGSDRNDAKGLTVEKVMMEADLNVMNTGDNTYYSTAYRSFSAIDVILHLHQSKPFLTGEYLMIREEVTISLFS